jgi:hypothetical protein
MTCFFAIDEFFPHFGPASGRAIFLSGPTISEVSNFVQTERDRHKSRNRDESDATIDEFLASGPDP